MIATKFVRIVTVVDPDSKVQVDVEIRKMETGPMVGIDGSWLDQDVGDLYSPYDKGQKINVPDNETDVAPPDPVAKILEVYTRVASGETKGSGGSFYGDGHGTLNHVHIPVELLEDLARQHGVEVLSRVRKDRI